MLQILTTLHLTPHDSPSPATQCRDADHRGHALRLSVTGALDIATADAFNNAVIHALHLPVRLLVLDFDGVPFCDAAGISALVRIHRTATEAGTRCVLTGLQPPVERVLNLVGLDTILRSPTAGLEPLATNRIAPSRPSPVSTGAIDL